MKFGSKQLRLFSSLEKCWKNKFRQKVFFFFTNVDFSRKFSLNVKGQFISNGSIILISLPFVHYFRLKFTSNIKQYYFRLAFIIFARNLFKNSNILIIFSDDLIIPLLSLVSNRFWYSDKRIKLIRIWLEPTEGQEDAGVTLMKFSDRLPSICHINVVRWMEKETKMFFFYFLVFQKQFLCWVEDIVNFGRRASTNK